MRYELFAGSLEDLLPMRRAVREYLPGEFIYRGTPEGMYYLHSGIARAFHVNGPTAKIVHHDFFPAGEFFGESSLFPAPPEESAVAHTGATVSFWTPGEFQEIAARQREVVDCLVQLQAHRHERLIDRLDRAETCQLRERLMLSLADTAYRIGKIEGETATLPAITHETLSTMVGTTREIVTFHMNQLRKDGVVQFSRKEIVVLQLAKAQEAAA